GDRATRGVAGRGCHAVTRGYRATGGTRRGRCGGGGGGWGGGGVMGGGGGRGGARGEVLRGRHRGKGRRADRDTCLCFGRPPQGRRRARALVAGRARRAHRGTTARRRAGVVATAGLRAPLGTTKRI